MNSHRLCAVKLLSASACLLGELMVPLWSESLLVRQSLYYSRGRVELGQNYILIVYSFGPTQRGLTIVRHALVEFMHYTYKSAQ